MNKHFVRTILSCLIALSILCSSNVVFAGEYDPRTVVPGVDGWYFFDVSNNLQIAYNTYPVSDTQYVQYVKDIEQVFTYLNQKNIQTYFITVPSKVSIYPEKLNPDLSITITPADKMRAAFATHTKVNFIDLKTPLLEAKNTQQVYFKTDSHWNPTGAYEGYKIVYQRLLQDGIIHNDFPQVERTWVNRPGEVSSAYNSSAYDELCEIYSISNPKAQKVTSGPKFENYQFLSQKYEMDVLPWSYYENSSLPNGKKLILFADSLFTFWNVPEMFAENFSEVLVVWRSGPIQEIIDVIDPDVVIYEIAERGTSYIPSSISYYWDYTFPSTKRVVNPNYAFVDYKILDYNPEMNSLSLTVTVKNTSGSAWNRQDAVRGCLKAEGIDDVGERGMINAVGDVNPNQSVTFTFTNVPVAGVNQLYFTMVQDGVTYFGPLTEILF